MTRQREEGAALERRIGWMPALVIAWLAAPLVLVAALTWVSWQQSMHGPSQAVWVAAEDAGPVSDRRVELAVTWSSPVSVVAPGWAGLVRQVSVAAGQTLATGDPVAQIDGITRLAWHAPAPFYRSLTARDAGDDVASLNALLRHRGLAAGDGDVFTAQTRLGVRELGRQLGVADNGGVFDPALVVFLSQPEMRVTEVMLRIGEAAPTQGSVIFTTAPTVTSVVLAAPGTATTATGDADQVDGASVPTITAAHDETLVLGDTELTFAESRDRLDTAGIAVIEAAASSDQAVLVAFLRRELPGGSVRIPSAALHTAPDGTTCVVTGARETPETVKVSVVGGLAGETVVTGAVIPGRDVSIGLLAPGAACD